MTINVELLSPARAPTYAYDLPRGRLYDYDDMGNPFREHTYPSGAGPQIGRDKGRYISSDPIGIAGGLNTFGYVKQNPVMRIDPLGFDPGDPYPSIDAAANAALDFIYPTSKQEGIEYSGLIYVWYEVVLENGQPKLVPQFTYTDPITSIPPGKNHSPGTAECIERALPEGNTPVAGYHTHPPCPECSDPDAPERFSGNDKNISDKYKLPEYMRAPSGKTNVYPPNYTPPDFSNLDWLNK